MPDVLVVPSTVLRNKRTLDGAGEDKIISDLQAGNALAAERQRRAVCAAHELSANSFAAEYGHADDPSMPHDTPDQVA